MQAGPMKLLGLLKENKTTFNIPVYQRNYEWNKEQVEQFFRDIEGIIDDIMIIIMDTFWGRLFSYPMRNKD